MGLTFNGCATAYDEWTRRKKETNVGMNVAALCACHGTSGQCSWLGTSTTGWPTKTLDLLKNGRDAPVEAFRGGGEEGEPPRVGGIRMICVDWEDWPRTRGRRGEEVPRASTVHLCPASWQPVCKASVLRVSYSGRSCSSSEARRSSLRGYSPVLRFPPGK